jgi:hypothetical protein
MPLITQYGKSRKVKSSNCDILYEPDGKVLNNFPYVLLGNSAADGEIMYIVDASSLLLPMRDRRPVNPTTRMSIESCSGSRAVHINVADHFIHLAQHFELSATI